ncbi:MAG TPA: hypothetical protein VGH20_15330 [Myxococcales bacterium]|jgi:hypothetical protein
MRALLVVTALAAAMPLRAQTVNCSSLPHPVWLEIGDTQEQLIKTLGAHLASSTAHPLTLVYHTNGSCTNVADAYAQPPNKLTVTMNYVPAGFNPATASPTCVNDIAGGHVIDVANSALFVSSCTSAPPKPANVSVVQGPIQAYTLVVPNGSSQTAITAEEAYMVFGFGNNDGFGPATPLSPWNDTAFMFTRPSTKSTLLTWVASLSVPGSDAAHTFTPAKFLGTPEPASTDVVSHVTTSTSPEKTIGLLGAEVFDANPTALKELAFQWWGQTHAYYPDSTLGAHDKKNLRDGHYAIWSPTFWIENLDAQGAPANPDADFVIQLILGQQQTLETNPLLDVVSVGLVPSCAMAVNRTVEGGPLSVFNPAPSCSCFYEANVPGGHSACATCSATTPCQSGTCRAGFCEAR